jgi:hypothetical protein
LLTDAGPSFSDWQALLGFRDPAKRNAEGFPILRKRKIRKTKGKIYIASPIVQNI